MTAQAGGSIESMRNDLAEIERAALESANSMRDMIRIIQTQKGVDEPSWISVLENLTKRLLRSHQLDLALPTAPLPQQPDPESRREIYLFCKEVLHNIARHAQATHVTFHLTPTPKGIQIILADNGVGFDTEANTPGHGLCNLKARAGTLNATLSIHSQPGQGTTIHLDIPANRQWTANPTAVKNKNS
jgi:signal transduction histidine kinase